MQVSGLFFKAMAQAVLLFGLETWVVIPRMRKALGGVSGPGGKTADGAAPAAETERDVGVHLVGNGNGGVRFTEYGGLYPEAPEHGRTVNCYAITVRPV